MLEDFAWAEYAVVAAICVWYLSSISFRRLSPTKKVILIAAAVAAAVAGYMEMSRYLLIVMECVAAILVMKGKFIDRLIRAFLAQKEISFLACFFSSILYIIFNESRPVFSVFTVNAAGMILLILHFAGVGGKILQLIDDMSFGRRLAFAIVVWVPTEVASYGVNVAKLTENGILRRIYFILDLVVIIAFVIVEILYLLMVRASETAKKESLMKEQVISEQKALYDLLTDRNEDLRRFRHDVKNRLATVGLLLSNGEYDEAKKYLSEIADETEKMNVKHDFADNKILNAVMAMTYQRAKQDGIDIEITGRITVNEDEVYSICNLFSNAINNAVEACKAQKIAGPVRIKITSANALRMVEFSNPATPEMYDNIVHRRTSKENVKDHGFGIGSIKGVMKEVKGECSYEYESGNLTLTSIF